MKCDVYFTSTDVEYTLMCIQHHIVYDKHHQASIPRPKLEILAMNTRLLSELFGGADRYKALSCIFQHSERDFGARELASEAHIDPGNASRWLRRWADVGLLDRAVILRQPRYSAAKDPALAHLRLFFQQDSHLVRTLREQIETIGDRLHAAAIFGSVAKGTAEASSDIDVLLLTDMPRLEAQALFKPAGRKLGRPVNVLAYKPAAWKQAVAAGNPLVRDILDGPLIELKGVIDAFA